MKLRNLSTQWEKVARRGIPIVGALLVLATLTGGLATAAGPNPPEITVISNRADLVSGGDALVEITLPDGTDARQVRVELDGREVTHQFAVRPNGRYQGVVTGLRDGGNELTAFASRSNGASLTITNHSKQGPVIAGDQAEPWICETQVYGLGPAQGPDCVAPTRHEYFYKSTATGGFETYDPASPPADALIARTTTDQGVTVPYIVRRERGVIDRGIYDVAVLYEPGADWQPWAPQAGWNGKLHWVFLGDCNAGHRQGGGSTSRHADVLDSLRLGDLPLSRGYAVAASTLTVLGNNCNDVVSAESVMMVKEHLTESYGPIRYTTGIGGSGGSIQQFSIANNYPGLLDGLMPVAVWADTWNVAQPFHDCRQLSRYFNDSAGLWASLDDRAAATGVLDGCTTMAATTLPEAMFDPRIGCASNLNERPVHPITTIEPDWVYDPQTNPDGVRCTIQDYQEVVYGKRSSDGFANKAMDDVGVQYGLASLVNGRITPEQFVDLNVRVGGRDIDDNPTARRTEADADGLRHAYRSGRVNDARQLDQVPIMELRPQSNQDEVHPDVYGQMVRARLVAANGHADNHVRWTSLDRDQVDTTMARQAFLTLDRWLAAIEADTSDEPLEAKVLTHKPAEAKDTCWAAGRPGLCGSNMPHFSAPRLEAGAPMRMDILKCQLKPIDWNDYGTVAFTADQRRLLQAAFPQGVCDWSKPGVEQQPAAGVWQSFANTIGGAPLGPEPRSLPTRK